MRKIVALVAVVLFMISLPLAVQAADKADMYKVLEAKVKAASGDRSLAADGPYEYACIISYTESDADWWSGLAIYNFWDQDALFMIGAFDANGATVAEATFSIADNAMVVDFVDGFFPDDTVTGRKSIAIFFAGPVLCGKDHGQHERWIWPVNKEAEYYGN
jgi:hypothetical protein